jgi:heat shock protein HslJ
MRALLAAALGLIVLMAGACAPRSGGAGMAAERRVTFLCPRGVFLNVAFAGDTARLESGDTRAVLQAQPVASGLHYAGGGHDLRGKGSDVTWTDAAGTAVDCRDQEVAMRQPQIQEPVPQLPGTRWRLVHFQSSDDAIGTVVPPRVERYEISFGADGRAALMLDCNRANAGFTATPTSARGGELRFAPGMMSRAFCGADALDGRIARDLDNIRSFTIIGNRLSLALLADGGLYVWERLADAGQ